MSADKDIIVKLDQLLSTNTDISPSERLIHLQDLSNSLPKSHVPGIGQKLNNVLNVYLHSKNFELQKCAINLLHNCFENKHLTTLHNSLSLSLAYAVIFLCNSDNDNLPEYQEVWLKAFDTLQLMTDIYPVLNQNHGTRLLSVFQKAVTVPYTSAVQKYKALQMLDKYISSVDLQNVKELLYHISSEQLLPLAFSKNNDQFTRFSLQIIYRLLPIIKQVLVKYPEEWEKIFADIRTKYVPVIEQLIAENNCLFAKLWIFLIKLIGSKFHKGSPVVNSLLSCIEAAFKVPNLEVRRQSFFCWQVLIENFTIESNEASIEKRVKLLTIPLKTNNGKTEELAKVKITVWGKLLDILIKNNLIGSFGVLDAYLAFCFGPFCYKDNSHALISQGKKYPSVHLITCKSLLQLIGNEKYIDEDLAAKLTVLNSKWPVVKTSEFCDLSESIIDSVGESCIMLSQLENADRNESAAVNKALWKSCFAIVDSLENQDMKKRAIHEISKIILVLINVARKKSKLINFGLKPLFNIITSNEFRFCQEDQFAKDLFIPMIGVIMKKDKILLHDDVITILKNVFIFKRNHEKYLEFIEDAKDLLLKEITINADKINYLRSIWYIIQEELIYYFDQKNIGDERLIMFYDFLNWPINTSGNAKSNEKIDLKWKELYSFFCKNTSSLLQSKLSCKLMQNIRESLKFSKNNKTIAEYCYYIMSNLKLENCDEETCERISEIYSEMKMIISTPDLPPEIVNIYESCVSYILDTSSKFPKLHCLLPSINGCLSSLLELYAKTDILRPATLFLEQIDKNDDKLKTEIEALTKLLDTHKKNAADIKMTSVEVDMNLEKTEKEQPLMILMGHDVNTMTPVKVKGSMLKDTAEKQSPSTTDNLPKNKNDTKDTTSECVFINSPYKFDPKKLTKQQKEKLFRRRDDIPALYQDLTQSSSQMHDLSTSNSESLLEIKTKSAEPPKVVDTANIMQTKESIISEEKTENTNKETKNIDSVYSIYSEDIIQSDTDSNETNVRTTKRRRKSLLLTEEVNEPVEKKKRGRKSKSADNMNASSNGISKENMDVNQIASENANGSDLLKVTRKRRSIKPPNKLLDSQFKSYADVIESVIENESNSSDAISESSQQTAAENAPIKLRINRNRRKSILVVAEDAQPEQNEHSEATAKTDVDNNLSNTDSVTDTTTDEKMELISLEANTELNKLENTPLVLKRPAKIYRSNRRMSEGNVVKQPTQEKNIIDYANLFVTKKESSDEKTKRKIEREVKLLKLDIKNSEEYIKTNGRKTRRAKLQNYKLNQSEQKTNENYNESDESDFIESSQENEKQANNIKECEVRALYSLDKITSGLLLQESDVNNRPKISPIKINIKSNKLIKIDSPKSDDTQKITEELPLIMDELESENVVDVVATETETQTQTQVTQNDENICDKRKVILSNSLLSTEEETPATPPKQANVDNIPTSPVCNDTPTRNKELLEDTLEISPIKKVPNAADDPPNAPISEQMIPPAEDQESPDLFESETAASQKTDDNDTDKVSGNTSQYTNRILRKNKSRVMSGRSAKMMKMISAKQTFVPATSISSSSSSNAKVATTSTTKMDSYCSPSSNRTKKMMINLEKCDIVQDSEATLAPATVTVTVTAPVTPLNQAGTSSESLINQDDVLCFEKPLPSPLALPGGSILKKKRKRNEESPEETSVPSSKKHRVNFSDPPVSSLKFIEKTIKPAFCLSKHLPKELRTTRSTTAEEQEIENETNAEQQESPTLLGIYPIEEDTETPENTLLITLTKTYDNSKPICDTLVNNDEPVTKILAKLTNSLDFIEPVSTVLENKNIDTIGDLAKLTESEVHVIPLKVETVKTVLKEYFESLKPGSPAKEKRKITPLVLSSPEKKTEQQHSMFEVSVIIENKDVISETQLTPIVATKPVQNITSNNVSSPEKLFSTESEKIEVPAINKIKTATTLSVSSSSSSSSSSSPSAPQEGGLFSSPASRSTIKTEFDSPTNAKDNILNEEYCNVRVAKFLQFIRNLLMQKKFDPKPIITALFANNTQLLTEMNCWEDLVKYIVRDVGIWKLTKYLCSLKNIPALMIESILKNSLNEIGNDFICERLNKHEIIKFLSKEYNLISLLQEYDAQTVYTTFFDLANDTQYTHLKYKEMLQELYACVFQPQIEIIQMMHNLDAENIGSAVVKRMGDPQEMDTFLETVCKSVPLEVYLKPTKDQTKKLLPITDNETSTSTSTSKQNDTNDVVSNAIHSIDNNELSKDEELMILRSIAKKWNALEFFQTFSQHTK